MRRLVADLALIVAPIATLTVFWFIGDQPKMGVVFAILTLVALVYVRPHEATGNAGSTGDDSEVPPQITSHPGAGGGAGMGGG